MNSINSIAELVFGSESEFGASIWINALWGVVLLMLVSGLLIRSRSKSIKSLADEDRLPHMIGQRRRWIGLLRLTFMIAGLSLIVISIMQPRANPHQEVTESKGRDIVFVVDVSKSMLARDVAPNRLERSKIWIRDLVAQLKTDRIGLVAFAGSSSVESPLTSDRLFFDLALEELGPSVVDRGGTNIGDAIRRCMDMVFYDLDSEDPTSHRDIILITDGEDQESLPIDAANAAGAAGIRILALGIGSQSGSAVLDENNRPVRRGGSVVRSKLDSSTLSKIATATPGGAYLEIGTGDIDLPSVYQELISRGEQATIGNSTVTRWDERYAHALAPGLILILLELLLSSLGLRKEPKS